MTLPAVSLWQPWASLMALGVKTIETRPPWAMRLRSLIGEDLAICSTKSEVVEEIEACAWPPIYEPLTQDLFGKRRMPASIRAALPRGSVLAVVRVAAVLPMVDAHEPIRTHPPRCIAVSPNVLTITEHDGDASASLLTIEDERPFGDYAPGRVGILTDNLRRLEHPVPCSGRQQVWTLPADVEAAVREQVAA